MKKVVKIENKQVFENNEKKCKIKNNSLNNLSEVDKIIKKLSKGQKEKMIKIAYKTDLITYIKVLLELYKSLPNIINVIDRLIEKRASTLMPTTYVYGTSSFSTYNEINKVIDMSERKDKFLNLYVIIEKMIESLNLDDKKFVVLKFVKKMSAEELAEEFDVAERTIYRRMIKVVEDLAVYMLMENYTTEFIKSQIGDKEPWITELFYKKKAEETVNKVRGNKISKDIVGI